MDSGLRDAIYSHLLEAGLQDQSQAHVRVLACDLSRTVENWIRKNCDEQSCIIPSSDSASSKSAPPETGCTATLTVNGLTYTLSIRTLVCGESLLGGCDWIALGTDGTWLSNFHGICQGLLSSLFNVCLVAIRAGKL
jgi:hypothetical protein